MEDTGFCALEFRKFTPCCIGLFNLKRGVRFDKLLVLGCVLGSIFIRNSSVFLDCHSQSSHE